jgi:uncharacterized protein YwqG
MKQAIADLLDKYRLSDLSFLIKDSLLVRTYPSTEDTIPVGASKIGGRPDLPADIQWTRWKGKPLAFIAQIQLAELPKAEFLNILPSAGILYFFYSADQETWGFDPNDKGSSNVIYSKSSEIHRRNFPEDLPDEGRYNNCSVTFEPSVTIPDIDSSVFDELHLSREKTDRYSEFSEHATELMELGHRILGHPNQIQGDMQLECQLASHGLYCGDGSGYKDPKAQALKAGAKDWELLFQVDSDDNAAMMWGDMGMLYYWIPRHELMRKNFDAAWMILQCS